MQQKHLASIIEKNFYDKVTLLAQNGNLEIIKMLKKGIIRINQTFGDESGGPTVIHLASMYSKSTDLLRQLINYEGVNINAKDSNGFTPLHYAAFNKNIDAIKILLQEAGADYEMPVGLSNDKGLASILEDEDDSNFKENIQLLIKTQNNMKNNLSKGKSILSDSKKESLNYRGQHKYWGNSEKEQLLPYNSNSSNLFDQNEAEVNSKRSFKRTN